MMVVYDFTPVTNQKEITSSSTRVVDGKISKVIPGMIIQKLKPDSEGQSTAQLDISIIVGDDYPEKQKWKLHTHEL
jgi:hypothetical protein